MPITKYFFFQLLQFFTLVILKPNNYYLTFINNRKKFEFKSYQMNSFRCLTVNQQ